MKSVVMNSPGFAAIENIITKEESVDIYSSDLGDMKTLTTEQHVEMYSSCSAVTETIVAKGRLGKTERIVNDEEIIEINSGDLNMDTNTTEKQVVEIYFSDPGDVKECIMKTSNTRDLLLEEKMNENCNNEFSEDCSDGNITEDINMTDIKIEDVDIKSNTINMDRDILSEKIMNEDSDDDIFSEDGSGENKTELIDITKIKMEDIDVESYYINMESSKEEDCIQNYIKSEEIEIKTDETVESDDDSEDYRLEEEPKKLNKHQVIHGETAKFKCHQCQKVYRTKQNLFYHIKSKHSQLQKYQCNYCLQGFLHKHSLKAHISAIHLKLRPYICKDCKKTFDRKYSLDSHIVSRHQKNLDLMKMVTRKIQSCDHCTYKCIKIREMKKHTELHTKRTHRIHTKFKCPQCEKGFKRKQSIENHFLLNHDNLCDKVTLKIHSCNFCSLKTTIKSQLKQHISLVHLNLRPYLCKGCKKTFTRKFLLDDHIVLHHQKNIGLMKTVTNKIYNCDHCTYKCLRNSVMENHIKTHSKHV